VHIRAFSVARIPFHMALVESLLTAIVRADGDALVMHVGERPYVVAATGPIELSAQTLNLQAMAGMVAELLPPDVQRAVTEFGAVEHALTSPPQMRGDHFTVVVARGGDDVWIEIRRHREASAVTPAPERAPAPEAEPVTAAAITDATVPHAGIAQSVPVVEHEVIAEHKIDTAPPIEMAATEPPVIVEEAASAPAAPVVEAAPAFGTGHGIETTAAVAAAFEETTPEAETAPTADAAPAVDVAAIFATAPIVETAPVVDAAPAIESTPVVETVPVAAIEPVVEMTPVVEAITSVSEAPIVGSDVAATEAAAEAEAIAAAVAVVEAMPLIYTAPVVEEAPIANSHADVAPVAPSVAVEQPLPTVETAAVVDGSPAAQQPPFVEQVATPRATDDEAQAIAAAEAVVASMPIIAAGDVQPAAEHGPTAESEPNATTPVVETAVASEPERVVAEPTVMAPAATATVIPMMRTLRIEVPPASARQPRSASEIGRLLGIASAHGATALYLTTHAAPHVRVDADVRALEAERPLSAADIESAVAELMPETPREALFRGEPTEFVSEVADIGRVRCSTFRDYRGPGAIIQLVTLRPTGASQLGFTSDIQALASESEGLVLVAAPRGQGKTTLVGAFVDLINRHRSDYVITLEGQIRLVHEHHHALVSQREVRGTTEHALAIARGALGESPDVLVIEDVASADMFQMALDAAGSGALVIASVTAASTTAALARLIDLFPPDQRRHVQSLIAEHLRGAMAQVLLRKTGGGRAAARELLLATTDVVNVLSDGQLQDLPLAIDRGRKHGLVSMTDSLVHFIRTGAIDIREAYRKTDNRQALLDALRRGSVDLTVVERLA
jgi:twitching motility protein PilT